MKLLADMFEKEQCYPYMRLYKNMRDIEIQVRNEHMARGEVFQGRLRMYIGRVQPGQHPGVYNQCQVGEIAAVYKIDDTGRPLGFNVTVMDKAGKSYPMSYLSENCDPMTSPLLFPRGERGIFQYLIRFRIIKFN